MNSIRLNLGCGLFPQPGMLNIDSDPTLPQQWMEDPETNAYLHEIGTRPEEMSFRSHDLTTPLSFLKDATVEFVHVGSVLLEMSPEQTTALLGELRRVLNDQGELVVMGVDETQLEHIAALLLTLKFTVDDLRQVDESGHVDIGDESVGPLVGFSAFIGEERSSLMGEPLSDDDGSSDWNDDL